MNDLNSYKSDFLLYGEFDNNIDEMGNVNLSISGSSENDVFIAAELLNYNYDTSSIEKLYDVSISYEQTTTSAQSIINTDNLKNSYEVVLEENNTLKNKLSELTNQLDSDSSAAEIEAQKSLIINLRIQLGQGESEADFNSVFPYERLQ